MKKIINLIREWFRSDFEQQYPIKMGWKGSSNKYFTKHKITIVSNKKANDHHTQFLFHIPLSQGDEELTNYNVGTNTGSVNEYEGLSSHLRNQQ